MLYFAYGSNLHPARMGDRTPSAQLIATGFSLGRRLVFHKVGRDGSAKCDAPISDHPRAVVFGAVYRLNERDVQTLDRIESLGSGYERKILSISTQTGHLEAFAYIAQPQFIDPVLKPFHWYKHLVVAGAKQHQFPGRYITAISAVDSTSDPQSERAAKNLGVLPEFTL